MLKKKIVNMRKILLASLFAIFLLPLISNSVHADLLYNNSVVDGNQTVTDFAVGDNGFGYFLTADIPLSLFGSNNNLTSIAMSWDTFSNVSTNLISGQTAGVVFEPNGTNLATVLWRRINSTSASHYIDTAGKDWYIFQFDSFHPQSFCGACSGFVKIGVQVDPDNIPGQPQIYTPNNATGDSPNTFGISIDLSGRSLACPGSFLGQEGYCLINAGTSANMSLIISNTSFIYSAGTFLQAQCQVNYATNTSMLNKTATCTTPPINLGACQSVNSPQITAIATLFPAPVNPDSHCQMVSSGSNVTTIFGRFLQSGINITYNNQFLDCNPYPNSVYFGQFFDNNDSSTFKMKNQFSATCGVYANGTPFSSLQCNAEISCVLPPNNNCQSICENGVLGINGTLINGTCTDFTSQYQCAVGVCGSPTTCGENITFSNTTGGIPSSPVLAGTPTQLAALFSISGLFLLATLMAETLAYDLGGEIVGLIVLGVMMIASWLTGLLPTWISFSQAVYVFFFMWLEQRKEGTSLHVTHTTIPVVKRSG